MRRRLDDRITDDEERLCAQALALDASRSGMQASGVPPFPTILFVDDETSVLDGLRRMLRPMRNDWEMTFANGGREALGSSRRAPSTCSFPTCACRDGWRGAARRRTATAAGDDAHGALGAVGPEHEPALRPNHAPIPDKALRSTVAQDRDLACVRAAGSAQQRVAQAACHRAGELAQRAARV